MITSALVRAEVVDIRQPASATPPGLVIDANVLYWVFYPNFSSLGYAGGRTPSPYQVTDYPRYWKRAARAGTRFHTVAATLGEFAKAAEYAELEAIWLTDPAAPQPNPASPVTHFNPQVCKFARYCYSAHLPVVRRDVDTMLASVRKSVSLLPHPPTPDALQNIATAEWRQSCGDYPDAVMIALAKGQSMLHVLSDDVDIATFPGITVYTANLKTINAASAAGKLH